MSTSPRTTQLEWEARWAKPVSVTAALAVLMVLASQVVPAILLSGQVVGGGLSGQLLTIDSQPANYVIARVLGTLPTLLLLPTLLFLYKAAKFRMPNLVPAARVLVISGTVLFLANGVLDSLGRVDAARDFAPTPQAIAFAGLPDEDRLSPRVGELPPQTPELMAAERGATGAIAAQPMVEIATTVGLAAALSLAFGILLISLFAMRAGLVSRFMGYIGIALGLFFGLGPLLALGGLPTLFDPTIIQMFWAGALALILVDRWPNGRGPAWSTGMAEPWPSAADQRASYERRKQAEIAAAKTPSSSNGGESAKRKRKKRG